MPKMALVLQGGGALGAYEYGAVTHLVELGWHPVAVTAVSIGAATAAAVAGARDGNICKSLKSSGMQSRSTQSHFGHPSGKLRSPFLAIPGFGGRVTTF
jgi:predicted acylesterase/phospholipase RssA